jgi:hypothetical protein
MSYKGRPAGIIAQLAEAVPPNGADLCRIESEPVDLDVRADAAGASHEHNTMSQFLEHAAALLYLQ